MQPLCQCARREAGFTLTELLVALVLGALVVLAGTAMVVTSRATYRTQDEATRIAESARFGLELVDRMVRLAGYTDFGGGTSSSPPPFYTADPAWLASKDVYALNGPNLVGANNSKPTSGATINGSDSLTIRFYGSGEPGVAGDRNLLDCAGNPTAAPALSFAAASTSRAYNVFFVEADVDGEPALKCRRQTYDAGGVPQGLPGDTQTLIRGVESFQVLYGEGTYAVGADPDDDLPITLVYRTGVGGTNPVVNWDNVRSVRIAMLLRSGTGAQADTSAATYDLFGASYPSSGTDPGTRFSTSALSLAERTRLRRVVQTTVFVRNRVSGWTNLQGIQ